MLSFPGCFPSLLSPGAGKTLTEVEIDEHLTARRAAQPGFVEPSFPTIAGEAFLCSGGMRGFGAGGAGVWPAWRGLDVCAPHTHLLTQCSRHQRKGAGHRRAQPTPCLNAPRLASSLLQL